MSEEPASTFYVATSIPYVNAVPHLGHAMEFVLGDVLARYNKLQGKEVFFNIGTDEHGGKVMETAEKMGISPRRYTDQISQSFRDLGKLLEVDYTKFIRTSDPDHEKRAAIIWKNLDKFIYKGTYKGMYDQREESFITPSEADEIRKNDPERFKRLESLEEENYYFKMSEFSDQIKQALTSEAMNVQPVSRRNEMLAILDGGLDDLSISRPKDKISWGIPVPGDDSQTIYVWFEALMNYITTLGYPEGSDFAKFWPCDVHVIGKDITRFHAIIWPAVLLALEIELPKHIYVHGFINVSGAKMSKSVGNVVAPMEIVSGYGADAFRYFFTRHIPSNDDGDFTWEKFEQAYNTELANDLGNLVQRTASMINRYQDGVIGEIPESMHDTAPYHANFQKFRFDLALDYVWSLIRGLNQYIEESKPWDLAKGDDEDHLREVLAYVVASLLQLADLLSPFIPQTAERIIQIFGEGVVKNHEGTLFPKIHDYTEPTART